MAIFEFMTEVFKLHEHEEDEKLISISDTITTPLSEEKLNDLNGWIKDKGIGKTYKLICYNKKITIAKRVKNINFILEKLKENPNLNIDDLKGIITILEYQIDENIIGKEYFEHIYTCKELIRFIKENSYDTLTTKTVNDFYKMYV